MKVTVGVSNRHVHLKQEHLDILFGKPLTKKRDVNQPSQFACNECVTIQTEKGCIENVRILGPIRPYTQIEISKTDAIHLGLNPPLRDSGDLLGSAIVTLIGPKGRVTTDGCILARRHIHMTPLEKEKYGFKDRVCVKVNGPRGGIMEEVYCKVSPSSYFEMHIDTDEANALGLKNGDEVEIME